MAETSAPFTNLMFTISKPGWGTSTLVLSLASPTTYTLRLKRIVSNVSSLDDVREYSVESAASLDSWIRALGFYENPVLHDPIPYAGSWALEITPESGEKVRQGGTRIPDGFEDLLTTMIGLGLPGFANTDIPAFLSRMGIAEPPGTENPSPFGAENFTPEEMETLLTEFEEDPGRAEDFFRAEFAVLPDEVKRMMLEEMRQKDPENYEWWRRILFG